MRVSSACSSGKKGIGVDRGREAAALPKNQLTNREKSGRSGVPLQPDPRGGPRQHGHHLGIRHGQAVAPEGGNAAASSLPEESSPPCDAAIVIASSSGAPNEQAVPAKRQTPETIQRSLALTLERWVWPEELASGVVPHNTVISPCPRVEEPLEEEAERVAETGTLTLSDH